MPSLPPPAAAPATPPSLAGIAGRVDARLRELIDREEQRWHALDDVLAAIHATDALDVSREQAHAYARSARAALEALPPSEARDALGVLADYAVDRTR